MEAKFSPGAALSGFFEGGEPPAEQAPGTIDDVGNLLKTEPQGIKLADAITASPLDRSDFLLVLSRAVTAGVVEMDGENIRLTKAGQSIY